MPKEIAQRPTTEIVTPAELTPELAELRAMDTPTLRAELSRQLEMTADHLRRLAWIVRTLEERGEDLSNIRYSLLPYVRQIAHDQILPEIVVRFGRSPLALQLISTLPLPDQRTIAAGKELKLVVARDSGGAYTHRLVDPLLLGRDQLRQLFGPEGIRDEAEQVAWLESRAKPKAPRPGMERHGRIKIDRKHKTIRVGRITLQPSEVVDALARLNAGGAGGEEMDTDPEDRAQINVVITEAQRQQLMHAAANAGLRSPTALVRRALIALGLID